MDRKKASLLEIIAADLKKGYWKATDAARYAPMLFAMVPPTDQERKAVDIIHSSEEKEKRMKQLSFLLHQEKEGADFLRNYEQCIQRSNNKLLDREEKSETKDLKEIIMMLLATNMANQKSIVNLNADINTLYNQVYTVDEPNDFSKKGLSAEAVLTEYIVGALQKLGADLI